MKRRTRIQITLDTKSLELYRAYAEFQALPLSYILERALRDKIRSDKIFNKIQDTNKIQNNM